MNFQPFKSAYIRSLEAEFEKEQRDLEAKKVGNVAGSELRVQVARWVQNLSPVMRHSSYTLEMLLREFNTATPRALAKTLTDLGFCRFRDWHGPGPYPRLWRLPPEIHHHQPRYCAPK